jgi:hypothetical protein
MDMMIHADPVDHRTADTLAEVLDKPNAPLLKQILRTLGHERCTAILEDIRADTTPYTLDGFRVWLPTIPPGLLREKAIAALKKGDVGDFIHTTHSRNSLALVACNIPLLQHRSLYEAAPLTAFISSGTNRLHDPLLFQRSLFMLAHRQKLRDAGDPLPGLGPYTLYRGVAGRGTARRVRGLSWTGSLEQATWFAKAWHLPDPAVFQAVVLEQEILSYTHSVMKEDEYIVMLSPQTRIQKYKGRLPYIEVC